MTLLIAFAVVVGSAQAGTVMGTISVDGGKKLRNVIIYMEPTDGRKIGDGQPISITQNDSTFEPQFNVAVKGAKVNFVNNETKNIDHNVYSLSKNGKFDIGLNGKGSSEAVVFDEVGLIKFYCSVHKSMQGVLSIVPTPYFAKLSDANEFRIDNVPPGKWTIKAMIAHRRYAATSVMDHRVTDDELSNIEMTISKKSREKKAALQGSVEALAIVPIDIVIPVDGSEQIVVMLSLGDIDNQVVQQ